MPQWVQHAIWWQVYTLGFVGAEAELRPGQPTVHRLGQLCAWFDYLLDLGVNGIILGPIFLSSTHGYDTIDHFHIDPRLGNDEDFDSFLAAAHARGIRILHDGVFNHVGRSFPAFQQALCGGSETPEASLFRIDWKRRSASGEPEYATFEGHHDLVTLNHSNSAVRDYVVRVMMKWLERGVDGWRLDAAYAVPADFWQSVLGPVRVAFPEAYFLGEVIHGDYGAFARTSGIDAVTQYELWKALWSSIENRNLFELAWALKRHNTFLDTFNPLIFAGNHDVTRLASQIHDERLLPHALAILFFCPGTPCVYAGDEQAFRGVKEKRKGGDDAIRPAFPASPADLAPFGWSTYRLHQQLIGFRRRHAWLFDARVQIIHVTQEQMVIEARHNEHCVLLALNLSGSPHTLPGPNAHNPLCGKANLLNASRPSGKIRLPGYGWAIVESI
jgi:cyclomaltodextrinase / maltogenic alpha-amylase / neopullulanase